MRGGGAPRIREARNRESAIRIMRSIVEKRETCATAFFEIENIEGGRALIEIVAVPARIKSKQRTDQQPYRRFVRDNYDGFAGVGGGDLQQGGQGSRRHRQAALATLGREGIRIVLPVGEFTGVFGFDIRSFQTLPTSM